jgi:hypothetical protein
VWHKGTPSKSNADRSIRRLTRWEKQELFNGRPDLDPTTGGGFDMNKWMNGEEQDVEESESDDDMILSDEEEEEEEEDDRNAALNASNASSEDYHDAWDEPAEDERCEKENEQRSYSPFLQRLMQVGK